MATCTLFSVADTDLAAPAEMTLPTYDERTSKLGAFTQPHTAELGPNWGALHRALGNQPGTSPLGFLDDGGERFAPLDDGKHSSGRYFAPAAVVKLLAAVAAINDDYLMKNIAKLQILEVSVADLLRMLARVRIFLAEAVEGDRGVIVHKLF
ncbi:MAG: DUF1877 family protein [Myxococcales bacterium]|nr:DUF1877 family protein [Myxococcales bacterium]